MGNHMKKILIAGIAALGLVLSGCTESKTGLQKNVINTALDTCQTYLSGGLKSPSSLRISGVSTIVQQPNLDDIDNVFGNTIIRDNKISETARDNKARYREMLIVVDYEAQNSYGVYLAGVYQCKYLYELNNEEVSPEPLNMYLIGLKSDETQVDMEGIHIPVSEFKGSSLSLNKHIKTIMSSIDSGFSKQDEQIYVELVKKRKAKDRKINEQKLKRSSEDVGLTEIISTAEAEAAAAAAVAIEAAESISSETQDMD